MDRPTWEGSSNTHMNNFHPPQHPVQPPPPTNPFDPSTLTQPQQASLQALKAHFSAPTFRLPIPSAPNADYAAIEYTESLLELEQMWLSEECLLRFLRATKWNEAEAIARLEKTLSWRRQFGIDRFTPEYISPENETGKQIVWGFDNQRRPIWYMRPALQNTSESDRQLAHVFYTMSLCEHMMPRGLFKPAFFLNGRCTHGLYPPRGREARPVHQLCSSREISFPVNF